MSNGEDKNYDYWKEIKNMGYGSWDSVSYTTYANTTGRSVNSAGNLSSNNT